MIQDLASAADANPPLQRAAGAGRIAVKAEAGVTGLARLYQDGCAKIRLPTDHAARSLEAVLINTSGGLTGGDRMSWRVEAEAGAALTLTTQACEKVYRARDGRAEATVSLNAAAGARIDWLPQETILFFADDLRFEGPISAVAALAPTLAGGKAFASLLLAADDAARFLAPLRQAIGASGGASAFDGKLFARIVAADGLALRRVLLPAIAALRDGEPAPRVWRL